MKMTVHLEKEEKKCLQARPQGLTPVILGTPEAEINEDSSLRPDLENTQHKKGLV
jgi:hypothetical protein